MGAITTLKEAIIKAISYLTIAINNFTSSMMMDNAKNILKFNDIEAELVSHLIDWVGYFAFFLMLVYFVQGFIMEASRPGKDRIAMMDVIKAFAMLIFADVIFNHSGPIVEVLMNGSNYLMKQAGDVLTLGTDVYANISDNVDEISGLSILYLIFVLAGSLLGFIFSLLAVLILMAMVLSTKIELLLRLGFCPIGIAGFADPGRAHESVRYFKKLIGCAFTCAAIVLIIGITFTVTTNLGLDTMIPIEDGSESVLTTMIAGLFKIGLFVITPFVAVAGVSLAKSAINEVFA